MPVSKTTTQTPAAHAPCPTCAWFSRWLVERLGFAPGEKLRVVESHRLVVILPGDSSDERELASSERHLWPAAVVGAVAPNSPTDERR